MDTGLIFKIAFILFAIICISLKLRGNSAAAPKGLAPAEPCADQGDAKPQTDLDAYIETAENQEAEDAKTASSDTPYEGKDVPQDFAAATEWCRKGAEQGDSWAQFSLGNIYYHGAADAPPDYAEAAKWLRKSADQGEAEAQDFLGGMYYVGEGVVQDYAEAANLFRKAADQGYVSAQGALGEMYKEGKGVPQNPEEAYFWLSLDSAGSADLRDEVAKLLRPEQLVAAQQRANAWKPVEGLQCSG